MPPSYEPDGLNTRSTCFLKARSSNSQKPIIQNSIIIHRQIQHMGIYVESPLERATCASALGRISSCQIEIMFVALKNLKCFKIISGINRLELSSSKQFKKRINSCQPRRAKVDLLHYNDHSFIRCMGTTTPNKICSGKFLMHKKESIYRYHTCTSTIQTKRYVKMSFSLVFFFQFSEN